VKSKGGFKALENALRRKPRVFYFMALNLEKTEYKPKKKKSRKALRIILSIFFGLILIGGGLLYAFGRGIFTKNWSGSSPFFKFLHGEQNVKLKGEGDGRINILFLGYGGSKHPGGNLTDTIQVVSINPEDKSLAMLSIPRDLYVTVKNPSYAGKINGVYNLGNEKTKEGGANLMKQEIGTILDLPIHYYVGVDFGGFKKAVDAIGGIDVYVEKDLSDPSYPADDMIHFSPFKISAGQHHMDGETALKYTRSRESTSDFDRSARQQKVISAFKDKILSSGILNNPEKVVSLANIAGLNIKTDLSVGEVKELAKIVKELDKNKTISHVLDNDKEGPLISDSSSGTFYLKPKSGNWREVQKIAHEIFTDPFLRREAANIEIINASHSSTATIAALTSTLKSYGYNIVKSSTAKSFQKETEIHDYSKGNKKYTLEFLANRLRANVITKQQNSGAGVDLQLIVGDNYKEAYVKSKN